MKLQKIKNNGDSNIDLCYNLLNSIKIEVKII